MSSRRDCSSSRPEAPQTQPAASASTKPRATAPMIFSSRTFTSASARRVARLTRSVRARDSQPSTVPARRAPPARRRRSCSSRRCAPDRRAGRRTTRRRWLQDTASGRGRMPAPARRWSSRQSRPRRRSVRRYRRCRRWPAPPARSHCREPRHRGQRQLLVAAAGAAAGDAHGRLARRTPRTGAGVLARERRQPRGVLHAARARLADDRALAPR